MEVMPDKQKVVGLVEQAHIGKICLPNFQRDFVWTRDAVADLVRSIVRGYFIGSLLLLESDPLFPPFAPVFLRGAKPVHAEPRPEFLILDGQQRISSLIYALTAPDLSLKDSSQRRWFFLDLDLLLGDPDNDEIVFDRAKRELRGLDTKEEQFAQRMLPCTALLSQDRFFEWRDGFEDWLEESSPAMMPTYKASWRNPWTAAVTAFQTFDVTLVKLPRVDESDSQAIGRVCAIFEKLNSTGVELSVYDLLTARLYRSGIRLHDLWDGACKANERLQRWSEGKADHHKFGVLVLRTLALLRGLDPKPRILIDLSPTDFERDWRSAAASVDRALELLELVGPHGFAVFDEKWLPGFGLVPILAALRTVIEQNKLGEQARTDLRRWYWCNVFLERYSSAVESKSRKDYSEMSRHWLDGGTEPDVFAEAQNWIGAPGFRVRGSSSFASAVYSGIFCLLALDGARDWCLGEHIQLQELEDHHIFPQAYLKRHKITKSTVLNTVANRTLISGDTNGRIRDMAPATYLSDRLIFPAGPGTDLMQPHFIDALGIETLASALEEMDDAEVASTYERFCSQREAAIIEEIRRVCGVRPDVSAGRSLSEPEELAADVLAGQ